MGAREAVKIAFFLGLFGFSCNIMAKESEKELSMASNNYLKINHFAEHIAAPFENDTNFGYGPYNNYQDILNFKPVIPFRLTSTTDLIVRVIAPLFERTPTNNQHNTLDGNYINGWGDINPTFFISPSHFETVSWGLGLTTFFPTATNATYIGSGKYSVGPELAVMNMQKNWMFGFLTYNIWSVAGDQNRPTVGQFSFQYLVTYLFDNGWYVSTNPNITADWKAPVNQRWLVPFGVGGGRSFYWKQDQPVSVSTYAYYNAIRPSGVGPNWQLQLSVEFLLPPKTI